MDETKLTPELIVQLQTIFKEQFGNDVSLEDCEEIGVGLVELYQLLLKLRT